VVSRLHERPAGGDRLAYPVLLALGALDAAAYSVIAPVLPAIRADTGAGPALIGGMVAAFPLAMLVGFALAGRAIRRLGTRPVLLIGLASTAAGCLGFIAGDTLVTYAAARALMGLGSGGVWIALTFETLARWPGQEYTCMSRIFAAYSAGGLIGPLLGALGGVTAPFAAYLAATLAGAALAAALPAPAARSPFAAERAALATPGFRAAAAGILFATLALGLVEGVLPLHLATHLDQLEIGAAYAGASLVVAGVAAAATRVAPRPLVIASVILVCAGVALAGASSTPALWLLALLVIGAGVGAGNTGSTGILLAAVPVERIVLAMVVWSQIGIVGYMLGPLVGGVLVDSAGYAALVAAPIVAGALTAVAMRADRPCPGAPSTR
jgi:MFS family permease